MSKAAGAGIVTEDYAKREMRLQGFNDYRSSILLRLYKQYLPVDILYKAFLENRITTDALLDMLRGQGYNEHEVVWMTMYLLNQLDMSTAIRAYWRGMISDADLYRHGRRNLYNEQTTQLLEEVSRPALSPADAFAGYWRGLLSAEQAAWHLAASGYHAESAPVLRELVRPRATPETLISAHWRQPQTLVGVVQELIRRGYPPADISMMLYAQMALLDPYQVRDLYLRREISDSEHDYLLSQVGYTPEQIERLKRLYYWIPSPPDLIRLAVREAWNEDIVRRFEYDAEFPAEFAEWAEKQGMSRDWAKRFWRAHWELPSPTMAYEMLHRRLITEEDLDALLKTADYPRFWRERLMKVSYNPYTRVDIRRMYQMGVLSKEEVYWAYRDIGYDDDHAAKLTAFTVSLASEEERDLTRSDILAAYADGTIDRALSHNLLMRMGYDTDEADLLLTRQERQIIKERRADQRDMYRKLYLAGVKDEQAVFSEMMSRGWSGYEVRTLIDRWAAEKAANAPVPSVEKVIEFYMAGVFDSDKPVRDELRKRGLPEKYIDWYIKWGDIERRRRKSRYASA